MSNSNRKTTHEYWESIHATSPRMKIPSTLAVPTRNVQRLLGKHIKPNMKVLEIGFAPGKQLSYVAKKYRASVAGVDFSETGVRFSIQLFQALSIDGDLRCEDIFSTTFPNNYFDVVYSLGVVEHFDDPSEIIRRHVELLKPGGTALITIPNFSGLYRKLQKKVDPDNLALHNLNIMSCESMLQLAPTDIITYAKSFPFGRVNPGLISFSKLWKNKATKIFFIFFNRIGLLQPFDIKPLCPMIVLKMVRA